MAVMAPGPYREAWQRAPHAPQDPGKTSESMSRLLCPSPAWAGSGWEASPGARPSERLPWQTKRGVRSRLRVPLGATPRSRRRPCQIRVMLTAQPLSPVSKTDSTSLAGTTPSESPLPSRPAAPSVRVAPAGTCPCRRHAGHEPFDPRLGSFSVKDSLTGGCPSHDGRLSRLPAANTADCDPSHGDSPRLRVTVSITGGRPSHGDRPSHGGRVITTRTACQHSGRRRDKGRRRIHRDRDSRPEDDSESVSKRLG